MRFFANLTIEAAPVAITWTEGDAPRCRIFRDMDAASEWFHENSLWDHDGRLFTEGGEPINPPQQPPKES